MVNNYRIVYTKQAQKDARKISATNLKPKILVFLALLENNPFETYPPYEKLVGDLHGVYSRRINFQHRLIFQVLEEEKVVKVIRMWTHYE